MKKTSIFKLFKLLKKFIPLIICSLLLSIIYVLCILIIPIIIGNGIDGIVSKGKRDGFTKSGNLLPTSYPIA